MYALIYFVVCSCYVCKFKISLRHIIANMQGKECDVPLAYVGHKGRAREPFTQIRTID